MSSEAMHRRPLPLLGRCVVVAALASSFVGVGAAAADQRTRPGPPRRVAARVGGPPRVEVLRLVAPGGSRPREAWVYRPGVPDGPDLPVLYFLHGVPGHPADVFDEGGLAAAMGAYLRAGGTPFVVAAPDGAGEVHDDSEWADAADGPDQLDSFLTRVVIPAVEGAHRRDAAHRAIAGFSMGGYGAMNLALRHRDLFGQVAALAGYFHVDDPDGVFAGRPDLVAANSPDRRQAAARGLRILLLEGAEDDNPVTRGETARYAALLEAAGIAVTVSFPPGRHGWSFVRDELPHLAAFLGPGWSAGR